MLFAHGVWWWRVKHLVQVPMRWLGQSLNPRPYNPKSTTVPLDHCTSSWLPVIDLLLSQVLNTGCSRPSWFTVHIYSGLIADRLSEVRTNDGHCMQARRKCNFMINRVWFATHHPCYLRPSRRESQFWTASMKTPNTFLMFSSPWAFTQVQSCHENTKCPL